MSLHTVSACMFIFLKTLNLTILILFSQFVWIEIENILFLLNSSPCESYFWIKTSTISFILRFQWWERDTQAKECLCTRGKGYRNSNFTPFCIRIYSPSAIVRNSSVTSGLRPLVFDSSMLYNIWGKLSIKAECKINGEENGNPTSLPFLNNDILSEWSFWKFRKLVKGVILWGKFQ